MCRESAQKPLQRRRREPSPTATGAMRPKSFASGRVLKRNFCRFAPRESAQPEKKTSAHAASASGGVPALGRDASDQRPTQ
jgi:hypothetical protein